MRRLIKPSVLFAIGGLLYILIELLWRGRTHWTMFFVGGFCFLTIGLVNEIFTWDMPLIQQQAISAVMITIVELLAGLLINCNYAIWDYRSMPLNIMGQICLPYTILWFILSLPAIILDDYLRYWIFGEDKPHYTFFKSRR
ncbi:MAG: putative ABC transporter permease [Lachnospiraceae bacterium]|nr:putative ABC transporter permease [Lachnospiraceae bacterium]